MVEKFDVVVIGSGPGGYSCAIRCAQKDMSVALIENDLIGGTCLNWGCVPSKALLGSAEAINNAKAADKLGIDISGIKPDWGKIQSRKDKIVEQFRGGLTSLIKANKIKIFNGRGIAKDANTVTVENKGSRAELKAGNIVLATGSKPVEIASLPFDGETVLTNKEMLCLSEIPSSLLIVGGGVLGCEMACVYSSMGSEVTIVEALPSILAMEDDWIGKFMTREFKKLGIKIIVNSKVVAIDTAGEKAVASLEDSSKIEADKVLISVGRVAVCDVETVHNLGLAMNGQEVIVDDKLRTNVPGVYAIGDLTGKTYLAHGAQAQAEIAAENIAGQNKSVPDYSLVPRAIYTFPEVASVGKTERKCKEENMDISVGKAFFRSNARSQAHDEIAGEIRVIKDNGSEKIVGVSMAGANVTELIASAAAMIDSGSNISNITFPHPTVSEVLKEAWEDAFGKSINSLPGK